MGISLWAEWAKFFFTATMLKVHLFGPLYFCVTLQLHRPLYLLGALLNLYRAFQYHMGRALSPPWTTTVRPPVGAGGKFASSDRGSSYHIPRTSLSLWPCVKSVKKFRCFWSDLWRQFCALWKTMMPHSETLPPSGLLRERTRTYYLLTYQLTVWLISWLINWFLNYWPIDRWADWGPRDSVSSYLVLLFAIVSFRCLLHDVSAAHCRLFRFWTCFLPSSWTTSTTWRVTGPSLDHITSTSSFVSGLSTTLMPRTHCSQLSTLLTYVLLLTTTFATSFSLLILTSKLRQGRRHRFGPWANWHMNPFQFLVWALSH